LNSHLTIRNFNKEKSIFSHLRPHEPGKSPPGNPQAIRAGHDKARLSTSLRTKNKRPEGKAFGPFVNR
jgi:hypothetical protein